MSKKVDRRLAGRRVLVVEDEYFIAADVVAALEGHGVEIVGPTGALTQAEALMAAGERIDAAVLDINLHGEDVYPLADALRARGVPFVFATGYSKAAIPADYADVPRWEKPYHYDDLVAFLPTLVHAA